jgi:hypothetical protein
MMPIEMAEMEFCDRCERWVVGGHDGVVSWGVYYRGTDGESGLWDRYMNPEEKVVCEECMQSDPRYLVDYPAPVLEQ